MRKLTEYEKKKWFDERGRFKAPEFLMGGDELGEAYETVERITRMRDYGLGEEFIKAAQIEILDLYYGQFDWIYLEEQVDFDEYGLPPYESLPDDRPAKEAWDWAMQWREDHEEETNKRLRAEQLRKELERLES